MVIFVCVLVVSYIEIQWTCSSYSTYRHTWCGIAWFCHFPSPVVGCWKYIPSSVLSSQLYEWIHGSNSRRIRGIVRVLSLFLWDCHELFILLLQSMRFKYSNDFYQVVNYEQWRRYILHTRRKQREPVNWLFFWLHFL